MGNTQCGAPPQFNFDRFSNDYTFVKKCNDDRFGAIKWLKNESTGDSIILKDYITNSDKEAEKYIERLVYRSNLGHQNILRIVGHMKKREDSFCATSYKVSTFIESFDYDLEEAIFEKTQLKVNYNLLTRHSLLYSNGSLSPSCGISYTT